MHYFLKPLLRVMRRLNDSELKLAFILGFLLFTAGILDLYWRAICRILEIQPLCLWRVTANENNSDK